MALKYTVFQGRVKAVECKVHSMAYQGHMPCTGVYRCIHCGVIGEDPLRESPLSRKGPLMNKPIPPAVYKDKQTKITKN